MSDTTKLVLGIVLAIVVIALIIWLFASARRREIQASRMEAEGVRARLEERLPVLQEHEDRASVTQHIAQEARREAEAKAAEAARLEREAAEHRSTAEQMRDEQAELARVADRIDPDVPTDDEGYRVDDTGRRLSETTVASAFGVGAAALSQDDDEPDLADHENPFPGYVAQRGPTESVAHAAGAGDPAEQAVEADWVNGPVDEDAADEVEARAGEDVRAVDWINGDDEGDRVAEADWVNGPVDEDAADEVEARAGEDVRAVDWINGDDDEVGADLEHSRSSESSAQNPSGAGRAESEHSTGGAATEYTEDAENADWVNGPVDEDAADEVGARAGEDVRAVDWINGDDDDAAADRGHSTGMDEGAPFDSEGDPLARRISGFDEISDGGYGVGSAAPIGDGAQPLGHPVMGFRESMSYIREGEGAHDAQPDVWFYDEEAARRSGFRASDES